MSFLKKVTTVSSLSLLPVAAWLGIKKWTGSDEVRRLETPNVEIPVYLEHPSERIGSDEELRNVRTRLEVTLNELFQRLSVVEGKIEQASREGPLLDRFLSEAQLLVDRITHLPLECPHEYFSDAPVTITFLTQRLPGYSMHAWNTVNDIPHLDYQLEKVQKIVTALRSKILTPLSLNSNDDTIHLISEVRYSLLRSRGLLALDQLSGISGFERILCMPFIESLREILELEQDLIILKLFVTSKRITRATEFAMSRDFNSCTPNEVDPSH